MKNLSAGAVRAVPFLSRARVKRVWSGLRPGTPDELPILGPVNGLAGYLNACGHFRTGILTSPLTGLLIAEMAGGARTSFPVEPFSFSRFNEASAAVSQIGESSPRIIDFMVIGEEKIHCVKCENRIGNELRLLPGIHGVWANTQAQQVRVGIDATQVRPDQVQAKLEQMGYQVTGDQHRKS